ncbi:MAG: transglycosylase SLT domain-containing protein [Rhodocyclaceae bacterium]|nr:transglycosylase SLT domain-containing protein [Rhodocyclaceae bacterium]
MNKKHIGFLLLFSLPGLLLPLPGLAQAAHPEDAAFQAAREAFIKGERAGLARAVARLKTHPLVPWANAFQFSQQLDDGSDIGLAEFIEQQNGTYLAEKMRGDWLKWLIRKEDWTAARTQFARLERPDAEANCRGIDVRLRLGEAEAVGDARALLASAAPLPEPCLPPLRRLAAAGELPVDGLWERLRHRLALNRLKEARTLSGWLPAGETLPWGTVNSIVDHPARYLANLPEKFAETRRDRELAMFAVQRVARGDARVAAARWQEMESRFSASERGFVWGRLALQAALKHQPEASSWFDTAATLGGNSGANSGGNLDEEQHAWRVRAALRGSHWPTVARTIKALPDGLAAQPEWLYWRARAQLAAREPQEHKAAQALLEKISGQPSFYGILASEALGRPFALPPRATPPSAEELAAAADRPGLVRGLGLIKSDMRIEGIREWNWALQGLDDRQLLAAAELAARHAVIDRAISTADRTRGEHDFALRYPTPFFAKVEPRVREAGLDPAWVYGLMRQESRFIMDAKSSAGARGLMQLMPATAKYVAKKIGMHDFHPGRVTEMDTNVILGTNYLRMVMDSLDNHPVLASAAYNAGPGRARRWRAEQPREGAIYAETLPVNETRDYVKKVMANAITYAAMSGGATPSLTARLSTIRPRGFGDGTAETLP